MEDHTTWQRHYPNESFRIGYVPLPPYHSTPDSAGRMTSGTWGKLVDSIIRSLEMTPQWIIPTDGFFGHKNVDGTFVGQWGLVMYNESDITLGPWPNIALLAADAPPSETVDYATLDFFGCIPQLFAPNQISVNLMDRYVAGAMILSMSILATISQVALWLRDGVWDRSVWWLYIRTLTLEPTMTPRHLDQNATRIVLAVWTLVLVVISQGINSDLKTSLIIQTPFKRLHTLDEIANQISLKPFLPTVLLPLFMGDKRRSMEIIAGRANDMGSLINADALGSPQVFREVGQRRAVAMLTPDMMKSSIVHVCPIVGDQYIYRVDEPVQEFSLVFYFRPDFDAEKKRQINKRINWVQETPFPWDRPATIQEYLRDASSSSCFATPERFKQTFDTLKPTSVSDIIVMVYMFWSAVAGILVTFLLELIYFFTTQRCCAGRRNKNEIK